MKWEDIVCPIPGRVTYTWDNRRTFTNLPRPDSGGDRILKRINPVYAPLQSAAVTFSVVSRIIPGHGLSDHLLILLVRVQSVKPEEIPLKIQDEHFSLV
jgi:hypothetical protein